MARSGVQHKIFRGMVRHIRFRNEVIAALKSTNIDVERNLLKNMKIHIKKQSHQWQKDPGKKTEVFLE